MAQTKGMVQIAHLFTLLQIEGQEYSGAVCGHKTIGG